MAGGFPKSVFDIFWLFSRMNFNSKAFESCETVRNESVPFRYVGNPRGILAAIAVA